MSGDDFSGYRQLTSLGTPTLKLIYMYVVYTAIRYRPILSSPDLFAHETTLHTVRISPGVIS